MESNHLYGVFCKCVGIIICTILVSSCATTSGGSSSGGWPIQTYPNACTGVLIPYEPSCLSTASFDGEFKYKGQFSACRQSMAYYTNALDEYYQCTETKLQSTFNELLIKVPETFNCYIDYFSNENSGDPSGSCPLVAVPRFNKAYEADGLEYDLGIPRCVKANSQYNFAPKTKYELKNCESQVDVFTGTGLVSSSLNSTSAQKQYNTYLNNLRRVLDEKAAEAVKKFNCAAEGKKYCF